MGLSNGSMFSPEGGDIWGVRSLSNFESLWNPYCTSLDPQYFLPCRIFFPQPNTLFSFLNKSLLFRAGIHKMLVRIANRKDLDQTASSV